MDDLSTGDRREVDNGIIGGDKGMESVGDLVRIVDTNEPKVDEYTRLPPCWRRSIIGSEYHWR